MNGVKITMLIKARIPEIREAIMATIIPTRTNGRAVIPPVISVITCIRTRTVIVRNAFPKIKRAAGPNQGKTITLK